MTLAVFSATASTKQIKNHTNFVRQCVLMIENVYILLQYNNLTVDEIVDFISDSDNYDLLFFIDDLHRLKGDFDSKYTKSINEKQLSKSFDREDKELLLGFFSMLGKSDLNGQLSNCKIYKEFFSKKLDELEKSEDIKCKNSFAIYIGLGLGISIMII